MPISPLQHIFYTQLTSMTWCATAQLVTPCSPFMPQSLFMTLRSSSRNPLAPSMAFSHFINPDNQTSYRFIENPHHCLSIRQIAHKGRQQQRQGVRLLLQNLLTKVGITDTLDESQFPYRLVNSRYYVCFSHSSGTDNKGNRINRVAVVICSQRAVGIDIETHNIAWQVAQRFYHPNEIKLLNTLSLDKRQIITKWLWQLKESLIKIHDYKLVQGLGISYAAIIPELIGSLNNNDSAVITIKDKQSSYKIALLPKQQALVVF